MTVRAPTGEVHPVAALFPMLGDEEMDELAADIGANGLLQPVICDSEGRLVDGRNRLAACEKAGVKPRFAQLPARFQDDAAGFILSQNIARRHLTAGQRAMLVAKVRSVCGKPLSAMADEAGVSKSRVAYAAVVLDFGDDGLVDEVVSGECTLDHAYWMVQSKKAPKEAPRRLLPRHVAVPGRSMNSGVLADPTPLPAAGPAPEKRGAEEQGWLDNVERLVVVPLLRVAAEVVAEPDGEWTRFRLPPDTVDALRQARDVIDNVLGRLLP